MAVIVLACMVVIVIVCGICAVGVIACVVVIVAVMARMVVIVAMPIFDCLCFFCRCDHVLVFFQKVAVRHTTGASNTADELQSSVSK